MVRDTQRVRPLTRIEPAGRIRIADIRELWRRRELIRFLFWRDMRVRYRQSVLGITWAVINPLLLMLLFLVIFGVVLDLPSEGVPRPVYFFSGILVWVLFSSAFTMASNSLIKDRALILRLHFPRLVFPISATLTPLVDGLIGLAVLLLLTQALSTPLRITMLLVPMIFLHVLLIALSVGIWFAVLNLRYRDFHHLAPLLLTVWFWATPVFYPISLVPLLWRSLYRLNPLVNSVEGIRWMLFGTAAPDLPRTIISLGAFTLLLLIGVVFFMRTESSFAEKM